MPLTIEYVTVGNWKENSYLLCNDGHAWLVDPGDDFEVLDDKFSLTEKKVKGIINTHGHFDHIGAVHALKTKYNVPFYIHSKDKQLVRQGNLYRRLAGDKNTFTTPVIDGFIDEMASFELGDLPVKIHHTPGHTHGSVCFEINRMLVSGDLLFKDSIGRTDLPGGNKKLLLESIDFVLHHFKGYTIYPGHGEPFVLDDSVQQQLKALM